MTKERLHTGAALALRIGCPLHIVMLLAYLAFDIVEPHEWFVISLILGLGVPLALLVLYLITLFTAPSRQPGKRRRTNALVFTRWLIFAVILIFLGVGKAGAGLR